MSVKNSAKIANYENLQVDKVCRLCLNEETNMKPLTETNWSSLIEDISCLTLEVYLTNALLNLFVRVLQ